MMHMLRIYSRADNQTYRLSALNLSYLLELNLISVSRGLYTFSQNLQQVLNSMLLMFRAPHHLEKLRNHRLFGQHPHQDALSLRAPLQFLLRAQFPHLLLKCGDCQYHGNIFTLNQPFGKCLYGN